jgi:hypothetical protein
MNGIRIFGALIAVFGLIIISFLRFRFNRLRMIDSIIGWAISLGLLCVAIFPEAFNNVLLLFSFEKGGGGRLIGLLIFSNILLYILLFGVITRLRTNENALNKLVRELAKKSYREQLEEQKEIPIYIVIPAYNEAENIEEVLQKIPSNIENIPIETLVVVDGATDNTEEVVNRLSYKSVSHIINRGGGEAIRVGCEIAVEQGAKIIVTLDADGQHNPEEIPLLIKPILNGEADLVNGSRVLGKYEKDSKLRALGVVLFNWIFSILALKRITDCSNSFRAIKAEEYSRLELKQSQFHSSELLLESIKKGLRVIEVPITIKRRSGGESKKGGTIRYGWGFLKAMISTWLR